MTFKGFNLPLLALKMEKGATSQGMQTASRTGNHKGVISPQASGRNMAQLLTHFRRLISRAAREHTWVVLSSPLL